MIMRNYFKLLMLVILIVAPAAISDQRGRIGGNGFTNEKAEQITNLQAPYPDNCKFRSIESNGIVTGQACFTVRSEPANGFNAFVIQDLWLNFFDGVGYTYQPHKNYMTCRYEIKCVFWDAGWPDIATRWIEADTTVNKGWMSLDDFTGLYHWPTTEGSNVWVELGSSNRPASGNRPFQVTVHLNAEGIDSCQIFVRPYTGAFPVVDSSFVEMPIYTSSTISFYGGCTYLVVPNKNDLYGRRLRVVARPSHPTRLCDYVMFGITAPGETGFITHLAAGYGASWRIVGTGVTLSFPWWDIAGYPRKWSARQTYTSSNLLEEDVVMFQKYPPIYTTLSADVSIGAAFADVVAPAGVWNNYVPAGNFQTCFGGEFPVLFRNTTSPMDSQFFYSAKNTFTDQGGGVWRVTFGTPANTTQYPHQSPRVALNAGDPVVLLGNWAIRGTGGEDWPWRGGYYNVSAPSWNPSGGFVKVRASTDYSIDSIMTGGTTLGWSAFRDFYPPTSRVMPFQADSRIWFAQCKDMRWFSPDSMWYYSHEFQGMMVYYADDLLEGNAKYYSGTYKEDFYTTIGDGFIDNVNNDTTTAAWVTEMNKTTGDAPVFSDADGVHENVFLLFFNAATDCDGPMRIFLPFDTDPSWVATTVINGVTYNKTVDSLELRFVVSTVEMRFAQADTWCTKPWFKDSTRWAVVASTQASMTSLVAADYDNVGEDTLGTFRASTAWAWGTFGGDIPRVTYVKLPASALTAGVDCKLAIREYEHDLLEDSPARVGANRYCRAHLYMGENSNIEKRPRLRVYYHLTPA